MSIARAGKLLTRCTCTRSLALRSAGLAAAAEAPARTLSTSVRRREQQRPWYVDEASGAPLPELSRAPSTAASTSGPSGPLPAPPDLPEHLHKLHEYLTSSPFLEPGSVAYVDAKAADHDAWVDWVVVCELRRSRERALRGAVEHARQHLAEHPVSSRRGKPRVTGLDRTKGAPTKSNVGDWAIIDDGGVIVHIMTSEAREHWAIEEMWQDVRAGGA